MKKILIFSLDYLPGDISGAEAAIAEITDRLGGEDFEFHMVTLYYDTTVPRVSREGNMLVYRVGLFGKPEPTLQQRRSLPLHLNKHYFQFAAFFKAMRLHRQYKYDAIWAMMAHGAGVPAALFKMFHTNVPYALTLQEGDPPEHIQKVMRPVWPLFKRAFTKADIVQAISTFLADWARTMGYTGDIQHIPNGANPHSINPSVDEKELRELKEKLGKKEGEIFLTNTARLVHQKGWETTIQALTKLPPHIKLLVVGGGALEDDLKQLVSELSLEDRVIFTGMVSRDEVSNYRLISDIFVGPSRSEGLGNAFLSAMACQLPVVATQVGGIADFLFDPQRNPDKEPTGFAVDPDEPEQIVSKVQYILDHPTEVSQVVSNARKMVEEKYTWEAVARQMKEKIFDRIMK